MGWLPVGICKVAACIYLWHLALMSQLTDFSRFLKTDELAALGPTRRPGARSLDELEADLAPLLQVSTLQKDRKQSIRALVLLWHDHLDPSHEISQAIDTPDGAFVHGIMHRREPDFGNAGYWFRRVGRHPAFDQLALKVESLLRAGSETELLNKLVHDGRWDPFGFINTCETASGKACADQQLLQQVQQLEFESLLESLQAMD